MGFLRSATRFDNVILIHGGMEYKHHFQDWLDQYRVLVNADTIYVDIDVTGGGAKVSHQSSHQVDRVQNVYLSGFSETMFHILAKSSGGCLANIVDKMDKKYQLLHSKPQMKITG